MNAERSALVRRTLFGLVALMALVLAASARAGAFTSTTHTQFAERIVRTNTCTGNPILFEGIIEQVVHVTVDSAGGAHGHATGRWTDTNVVDLVTGQRFRVAGAQAQGFNVRFEGDPPAGAPWTATFVFNLNLIAPGPGNNIVSHSLSHFTINANGEVTTEFVSGHLECR